MALNLELLVWARSLAKQLRFGKTENRYQLAALVPRSTQQQTIENSRYFQGSRPNVVPFVPPGARTVLEVGCGIGGFREHFAPEVEYWGVEIDRGAAQSARARLSRVLNLSFEQAADHLPEGYFDLIVCNDVIEHLQDHCGFLRVVKCKIRDGGFLIGSIPNVRYVVNLYELLVQRDWRYKDEGILDRTHLRFFTEKSLRRTLIENGFQIDLLQGIDPAAVKGFNARRMAVWLSRICLGNDTQYRQFGFRVRPR